jgi:hypothetical protein
MLGIGEVLYRALAAAVISTTRDAVAAMLQTMGQLAFGIPGGVEMAAQLVDIGGALDDIAAASLDVETAFYSMKRSEVLDGLNAMAPGLVRFFYWSYGRPIELRDHKGQIVGHAKTGVFIGDGMSGIYFPVALHRTLQRLNAVLREAEAARRVPEEQRGFVVSIADDITVKARTDVIMVVTPQVEGILEPAGLRLNRRKSFVTGPRVLETPEGERPPGWELCIDGRKTLGRPLASIVVTFRRRLFSGSIVSTPSVSYRSASPASWTTLPKLSRPSSRSLTSFKFSTSLSWNVSRR